MPVLYRIAIFLSLLLLPCAAMAGGGIYFDDFSVTNGGSSVFADNFDDGDVSDWQLMKDAWSSSDHAYSAPRSMFLNWHVGGGPSQASHPIGIVSPGVVEASSRVWLPPVQEQYYWRLNASTSAGMYLHSGNTASDLYGVIALSPGDTSYRLELGWNRPGGGVSTCTTAVLSPGTWGLLSLKMDPNASTARLYLDDVEKCVLTLDAAYFQSYAGVSLSGTLGSGMSPEPSGLTALTLSFPILFLLRRRKQCGVLLQLARED